jgi:hypothetical protein
VALLLVALATPAPASPAVKTARVTTSAVELVQYRRRPLKA